MKYLVFLADGMADETLADLNGMTPIENAFTPNLDELAKKGIQGTLTTIPEPYPTSSDAANLSVLGYDLEKNYCGRGPIEAVSQGISLGKNDIAFRCNLISIKQGILEDYSAGQLGQEEAKSIIAYLNQQIGNDNIIFYPGVSYRNILVLKGKKYSDKIGYAKPDSSQGEEWANLLTKPLEKTAELTSRTINELILKSMEVLNYCPVNQKLLKENKKSANSIWPWSPGKIPKLMSFQEKYNKRGVIISAVDVILGIGQLTGMQIVKPEGATGFVDTNFENKVNAAIKALRYNDFVFLHLEAIDECSHMGDLNLKLKAIELFDKKLVGPLLEYIRINNMENEVTFAVLPDHPVPVKMRKHTRTPVPFLISGPNTGNDGNSFYSERTALKGKCGLLEPYTFLDKLFSY